MQGGKVGSKVGSASWRFGGWLLSAREHAQAAPRASASVGQSAAWAACLWHSTTPGLVSTEVQRDIGKPRHLQGGADVWKLEIKRGLAFQEARFGALFHGRDARCH